MTKGIVWGSRTMHRMHFNAVETGSMYMLAVLLRMDIHLDSSGLLDPISGRYEVVLRGRCRCGRHCSLAGMWR